VQFRYISFQSSKIFRKKNFRSLLIGQTLNGQDRIDHKLKYSSMCGQSQKAHIGFCLDGSIHEIIVNKSHPTTHIYC